MFPQCGAQQKKGEPTFKRGCLETVTELHPHREPLWSKQMVALHP